MLHSDGDTGPLLEARTRARDATLPPATDLRPLGPRTREGRQVWILPRVLPRFRRDQPRPCLQQPASGSVSAVAIVQALPIAALLTDDRQRVLALNEASSDALRDLGVRLVCDRLRWEQPTDDASWCSLARAVACTGEARTMEWDGHCIGRWKLHLVPFELAASDASRQPSRTTLVVLELISRSRKARLLGFQQRFHLSAAETEVLAMLLQGMAPKEIAARRGTALSTVRTQMSALFAKTLCRSQRELIAAIGAM